MKTLIIAILMGITISCNNDGRVDECLLAGRVCENYGYDYYRCEKYNYTFKTMEVWYEVWDSEFDEWEVWYNYNIMYRYYCK